MSGPDFEGVLAAHRLVHRSIEGANTSCTGCDWSTFTPFGSSAEATHRTHLSAALHAEVARWLEAEGTREAVAEVIDRRTGSHMGVGSRRTTADEVLATLAGVDPIDRLRAALTTTTREDQP